MNDFETFDITHIRSKDVVLARAVRTLPDFTWHGGDSEAQGPYIVGKSKDQIVIKLWLGEEPAILTVSFRNASLNASDRKTRQRDLIESITHTLIPSIKTAEEAEADVKPVPAAAAARQGMA